MSDLRDQIKQKLISLLPDHGDFSDNEDLITSGRLNSLMTVELATWLETNYAINFDKCGFNLYDFESVSSILNMVQKRGKINQHDDLT